MMKSRLAALLLASALSSAVAVVLTTDEAEAVTCYTPAVSLTQNSAKALVSSVDGTCTGSISRTLYAEIKWDKTGAPDPLVSKSSDTGYKSAFFAQARSCDNGNTRGYYARGYWYGEGYHDDGPRVLKTC